MVSINSVHHIPFFADVLQMGAYTQKIRSSTYNESDVEDMNWRGRARHINERQTSKPLDGRLQH